MWCRVNGNAHRVDKRSGKYLVLACVRCVAEEGPLGIQEDEKHRVVTTIANACACAVATQIGSWSRTNDVELLVAVV